MMRGEEGVVVFLDEKKPIGILTERDLLYILEDDISTTTKASEFYKTTLISINPNRTLDYALHILIDNNIRRLVTKDDNGNFAGVVTQEIILNHLERDAYRTHLTVSNIVENHKDIASVLPDTTLAASLEIMRERIIGSIVIEENSILLGIFTERDIIKIINKNIDMSTPIKDVMNSPVITVNQETKIADATETMINKKIRRLVVVNDQYEAIGIIGTRDIMKNIQGNYATLIEQKLKIAKHTLDSLPNIMIVELFDDGKEEYIQWLNSKAQGLFGNIIDDRIDTIIETKTWNRIHREIKLGTYNNDACVIVQNASYTLSISRYQLSDYWLTRIMFVDVTEFEKKVANAVESREKILKKLTQQSRLAQMGEMISMIAHQWRQPLAAINVTVGTLKVKNSLGKYEKEFVNDKLNNIVNYVGHLSDAIDDFRNFFKHNKPIQKKRVEDIVKDTISIIQTSLNSNNITLVLQPAGELFLNTYINELRQVILNLVQNAHDVLLEREVVEPTITISCYQEESYIFLKVADNAGGISKDILESIFDPYFTTKLLNGTGLGL